MSLQSLVSPLGNHFAALADAGGAARSTPDAIPSGAHTSRKRRRFGEKRGLRPRRARGEGPQGRGHVPGAETQGLRAQVPAKQKGAGRAEALWEADEGQCRRLALSPRPTQAMTPCLPPRTPPKVPAKCAQCPRAFGQCARAKHLSWAGLTLLPLFMPVSPPGDRGGPTHLESGYGG